MIELQLGKINLIEIVIKFIMKPVLIWKYHLDLYSSYIEYSFHGWFEVIMTGVRLLIYYFVGFKIGKYVRDLNK